MPDVSSWSVISEVGSNRVILGIDFPAAGRAEGSLADLAARIGPGYGFLQVVPPRVSPDQRISVGEYTQHWLGEAQRSGWQVAAVIGYCLGSVYAAPIAESISGWQDPPPQIILFDPLYADLKLLALEANKIVGQFGPLLSQDEVALAAKRIGELTGQGSGESAGVADATVALVDFFREIGAAAFGRLGLNESRQHEMLQLFESYMSWIAVAAQINPIQSWMRSTAVMSLDYVRQADGEADEQMWSSLFGQQATLDVGHGDLLRSEAAAETVLGHMRGL